MFPNLNGRSGLNQKLISSCFTVLLLLCTPLFLLQTDFLAALVEGSSFLSELWH